MSIFSSRLGVGDVVVLMSGGRPFTISQLNPSKKLVVLVSMSEGGRMDEVSVHPEAIKRYTGPLPYVPKGYK